MKHRNRLKKAALVNVLLIAVTGAYIMMHTYYSTGITKKDFLKAAGTKLMTQSGEQVLLRGVNLGGWLIQEAWMCPLNKEDKGWGSLDTREALKKRGFTTEQILNLMKIYEDNWITEKDLDHIKDLGMNCVRVPFWYGNFYEDEKGIFYKDGNLNQNPGFKRLDWVIEECKKRGIYVILDMHGAPGFQNNDHSSGKSVSSKLFDDSKEGQFYRSLTVNLWEKIAARYVGNPAVAAYDLLNEPMNGFDKEQKNDKVLWEFYNELYKTIRKADRDHMITVEGIWELYNLPEPSAYGWSNVLYQTHNYNWKQKEIDQKVIDMKERINWNVPFYVGEFQGEGIWDYALASYNRIGASWTTWTYKGVKSTLEGWFLYRSIKVPLVNPETDSYEEILDKWSKVGTDAEGFTRDDYLADILKKYATEEVK